mgnify:CR=1 FL=1
MKKRFVAVLLTALFSVLLLTGCGGSDFFMTDTEFTRMINRELAESGNSIQLTYDSSLVKRLHPQYPWSRIAMSVIGE